jgi:hypothetical protein
MILNEWFRTSDFKYTERQGPVHGPCLRQSIFHLNGFILRDASLSLSSGAHSRDPLAMLLRMRSQTLMVRSASSRVSNHEATGEAAIQANRKTL